MSGIPPRSGLLMVKQEIKGAHRLHDWYPLLPGDCVVRESDGTYTKVTGLGISGFVLTDEQASALEPVDGRIVIGGSL